MKRKSDKSSFHDFNGLYHIGQETNSAKEGMKYPGKAYMKGSMLHRPKVTSVGGESIMLILLLLPLSVTGVEPGFISPLNNMTVAAGRSAHFTCVVKHLGGHKVAWLRSDSKAILAIHTHMVTNNPRMSVEHNGHNSWTLNLEDVQRNDSGSYMCQINTEPMTSQVGILSVVEAPDILYNETSNDTIVAEGASVHLKCEARGYPEPRVAWKRGNKMPIVLRSGKGTTRVETVKGPDLKLNRVTRADMGPYLCIASNGIPSPVSKRIMVHVHFHPLIKVHNQLISARIGATIALSCGVEASPRSVNYWTLSRGVGDIERVVNPGRRFTPSEEQESLYSTDVKLTIKTIKKSDFGNYTCHARNSFGMVKGVIALKELIVPKPAHEQNEKMRHRTKGRNKDIDSNMVSKYGSYETNRESRLKNQEKNIWGQKRPNQKNKNRNISTTKVPKFGVLTKIKSINDDEFGTSNQVTYNSILEDYKDGLEFLEDPEEKSKKDKDSEGFPFGSNASNIRNNIFIILTLIVIDLFVIVCM